MRFSSSWEVGLWQLPVRRVRTGVLLSLLLRPFPVGGESGFLGRFLPSSLPCGNRLSRSAKPPWHLNSTEFAAPSSGLSSISEPHRSSILNSTPVFLPLACDTSMQSTTFYPVLHANHLKRSLALPYKPAVPPARSSTHETTINSLSSLVIRWAFYPRTESRYLVC